MTIKNIKGNFVFARNPIIISDSFASDEFDKHGGRLSVVMAGTQIFEGRFFPPLNVDVAEIVDANIKFFPEPYEDDSGPIIEIYDDGTLSDNDVSVIAEYGGTEKECEFTAIPGGISKQNFRRYAQLDTDAFQARFHNPGCNFFLTTRTSGWRLVIKETELNPLYFILNGSQKEIDIKEVLTGTTLSFAHLGKGVYALNIDSVRHMFLDAHNVIPNIFDVYLSGKFSCRIIVERSDSSKERYRLKFRNSLGVFEIIELTGKLTISPGYEDAEDATFRRYDSVTGDFQSERERIERHQEVTIETGIKRPDEVRFMMDMIASEEVYLLDWAGLPVKVIPTIEDMEYSSRPETPETFTVKLEMAEREINIMQEIVDGTEGSKPRVFSKQFNGVFN